MKNKCLILNIIIGVLLFINAIVIIILKNVVDDKTLLINGYESDRNICRRELEELINSYEKLEKSCDK